MDKEEKKEEIKEEKDNSVKLVVEEVKEETVIPSPINETIGAPSPIVFKKEKNSVNKTLILMIFGALVLTLLIVGGVYVSQKSVEERSGETKPTPEVTATPIVVETTPTPEVIDRSKLKIQVLNGSGVAGKAGEVKTYLEGLGYKEIDTGNAKTYDYKNLTISVKKNDSVNFELMSKDISDKYNINKETTILESDSEYDLVLIIGK